MKKIQEAVKVILTELGEDTEREGLLDTPKRVMKMFGELTRGYKQNVDELINDALFSVKYNEMVVVKHIEFYSLCEHHMLPFHGRVSVGYIPNGKVVGLSKIPRIVDMFARRLQVQENMTQQIADILFEKLNPLGVGVVVEAKHMCMSMRGVEKHNANMVTSAMLGNFESNSLTRTEFLRHISGNDFSY